MKRNDLDSIREEIWSMADEKYRDFQIKLLPDTEHFVGVRLPKLHRLAKRIVKENGREYLEAALKRRPQDELFEEIMLQGMIIGYMESDISDIFSYAEKFVRKIDNWSVCDSFCSSFKHALKHQDEVWEWLEHFFKSEREFEVRFGVVMLLNYYIDDAYVNRLYPIFEAIRQDGYYVKMAVAWAISICYIKYPQKTMVFLRESKLDVFTYNKSLQKIVESRCVSEEEKIQIRKMRKFNA